MNTDKKDDIYTLDELILKLVGIRDGLECRLNFPKAYLTLCLEIQSLNLKMQQIEKFCVKITHFMRCD